MYPLATMFNTSLVVRLNVVSIKNDDTNDQQNDHQELKTRHPIIIGHGSSLLIIVEFSSNTFETLQSHLGDHVALDVTLLGEELIAPIRTSFRVIVIDVFKAISNEQFKSVGVHCRKSGEFNVEKAESISRRNHKDPNQALPLQFHSNTDHTLLRS
jgi:hypothetical protein